MPTIKIEVNVLKSILELNLLIPDDNNSYWVTAAEMRDRLVHCGVDKSLTLEMLRQAIKQVNRDGCYLIRRREGNEAYQLVVPAPSLQIENINPAPSIPNVFGKGTILE